MATTVVVVNDNIFPLFLPAFLVQRRIQFLFFSFWRAGGGDMIVRIKVHPHTLTQIGKEGAYLLLTITQPSPHQIKSLSSKYKPKPLGLFASISPPAMCKC